MTDEELQKIVSLIDNRMQARLDPINQRLDEQGQAIKALREDIQRVDMKVELVNTKVDKIDEKLDTAIKDFAGFFQEVGTYIDKTNKETVERVETIEKHLGFPKPKN